MENAKTSLLYVPMGTYGEVTPDSKFVGVYTNNIGPCCHIIIRNIRTGHIILCHADPLMNLKYEQHGIATWIRKVCPNGDYKNVEINIGDEKPITEHKKSKTLRTGHYYSQLIDEIKKIDTKLITIVSNLQNNEYGIGIMRSEQSLFYPTSDESAEINGRI